MIKTIRKIFSLNNVHPAWYMLAVYVGLFSPILSGLIRGYFYSNLWLELSVSFLYVCIGAPLIEEIIFRGLLWNCTEKIFKLRSIYVFLITTILFLLAHRTLEHMIGISILSICMGIIRLKSKSILPTIIAHATNNILVTSVMIIYLIRLYI